MFEDMGRAIGRLMDGAIYDFRRWYSGCWWYRKLYAPVFLFCWYHVKGLKKEQIEVLRRCGYLSDRRYAKLLKISGGI
jgi:hypothetical protein